VQDFVVRIRWAGDEDKPFYKALLVSASRASLGNKLDPFWVCAVISKQEFDDVLAALESSAVTFCPGSFPRWDPQYVAELEGGGEVVHGALGADSRTLGVLESVAKAVRWQHRDPIQRILARCRIPFSQNPRNTRGDGS
jgi:hypothetical protein